MHLSVFLTSICGSIVTGSASLYSFRTHSCKEHQKLLSLPASLAPTDGTAVTDSSINRYLLEGSQNLLPLPVFLASTGGTIASDSVSLRSVFQTSFEELRSLLLLPACLASIDGIAENDSDVLHPIARHSADKPLRAIQAIVSGSSHHLPVDLFSQALIAALHVIVSGS